MRNIETLSTKTGPDDAGLNSLACHISSRQLNHVEAAELLRVTAEAIQNEAQEIH